MEQDYRFIKWMVKLGLGFQSFPTAWRTLRGYETREMIRKRMVEGGKADIKNQIKFIENFFATETVKVVQNFSINFLISNKEPIMKTEETYNSTFWNLVQAIHDGNVVAFVGAGVSHSVLGIPTWNECISRLIDEVRKYEYGGVKTARFIKFINVLEKSLGTDPLFVAEQCRKYLQDKFTDLVKKNLTAKNKMNEEAKKAKMGLEIFMKMPFYRIVTTNYDNLLIDVGKECSPEKHTEYFTYTDVDYFSEFLREGDSDIRRSIFHLHGHLDKPRSIILTETQYQDLYSRKKVIDLLETIFSTKSSLFIGFSLKDYDIMQIFRRIIAKFRSTRERHFAILGKEADETIHSIWLDTLKNNYKYGIGNLYYTIKGESHQGLWDLISALDKEITRGSEEPNGKIAILMDESFPYQRSLYEIVAFLNKVQSEVVYDVNDKVQIHLQESFKGHMGKDEAFLPAIKFKKEKNYDGVFVLSDKKEYSNYLFFERKHYGFISTKYWSKYVGERPSIDEFLLHTLVLLTLHFYDTKYNLHGNNESKILQPHTVDKGCFFDFTGRIRNRIAVIDYPYICSGCKQRLEKAFKGKKVVLDLNWLKRVAPIHEELL